MDLSRILVWGKLHDILLTLLLTVISWAFSMTIVLKCVFWAIAWGLLIHLGFITVRTEQLVKVLLASGLTICLVAVVWIPVREAYRRERAAALTGYVTARQHFEVQPSPVVEIGDSGTRFLYAGRSDQPLMQILYDAGLRIEVGAGGLVEVSTPVRDRFGHIIAEISKNHWSVSPDRSVSWDKNYTRDALEVLDGGGHVVLQLKVLPDRVQLQGEWRDALGNGVQLMKSPDRTRPGAIMGIWHDRQTEQQILQLIPPMFKYPSSEHWGELSGSTN